MSFPRTGNPGGRAADVFMARLKLPSGAWPSGWSRPRSYRAAQSCFRPGNGAERLEKIESAPVNCMGSETSNLQHLVHGRAIDRGQLGSYQSWQKKAAIALNSLDATLKPPVPRGELSSGAPTADRICRAPNWPHDGVRNFAGCNALKITKPRKNLASRPRMGSWSARAPELAPPLGAAPSCPGAIPSTIWSAWQ